MATEIPPLRHTARQRSARAPRHPPLSASRHQFRPDPLLPLARNPSLRLHLNENRPLTKDDHRVGRPAPHASLLLQDAVQTRRRLVL
jgi:hypothetical protein